MLLFFVALTFANLKCSVNFNVDLFKGYFSGGQLLFSMCYV